MLVLLLLQEDLNQVVTTWNNHRIRYAKNQRCPHGRPFVMYYSPEIYGTRSFLCPINETKLNLCENYCVRKSPIPCDEDVFQLSYTLINENGWDFPKNPLQATELYVNLRRKIINLLWCFFCFQSFCISGIWFMNIPQKTIVFCFQNKTSAIVFIWKQTEL